MSAVPTIQDGPRYCSENIQTRRNPDMTSVNKIGHVTTYSALVVRVRYSPKVAY